MHTGALPLFVLHRFFSREPRVQATKNQAGFRPGIQGTQGHGSKDPIGLHPDHCSFLVSLSPALSHLQTVHSHLLHHLISIATTTTPMISLFEPELHYSPVCTLMVEWILLRCIISHRVKTPPRRSYLDKSNPMSRSVDKCSNAVLPKECLVTILWLSHWRCHHILEGSQLIS